MTDHAWFNDQRIQRLTGQKFSAEYLEQVLRKPDGRFDSGPATRALVAVGNIDHKLEPRLLNALQVARYMDGIDTALVDEVGAIATKVVRGSGFRLEQDHFARSLTDNAGLALEVIWRIEHSIQLMVRCDVVGIPCLIAEIRGNFRIFQGASLYRGGDALLADLAAC